MGTPIYIAETERGKNSLSNDIRHIRGQMWSRGRFKVKSVKWGQIDLWQSIAWKLRALGKNFQYESFRKSNGASDGDLEFDLGLDLQGHLKVKSYFLYILVIEHNLLCTNTCIKYNSCNCAQLIVHKYIY